MKAIPFRVRLLDAGYKISIPSNQWKIVFMSGALENGRTFRVLNITDDFNREALINEASYSIPAEKTVNSLKRLLQHRTNLVES